MTFRLDHLETLGDKISISIPRDEDGYVGRECPSKNCLGYFKTKLGTGLTGGGIPCHCPYCGHAGNQNTFFTPEQIEYARSMVLRKVSDAVRSDLKSFALNRPAKGSFGIGLTITIKEGSPIPIRHYREKKLETKVICNDCTLHYAIYGLFGFCPDCGTHNSFQILEKNLDLVRKQIDLAETIEDESLRRHLVEDALENCVSSFEGFGRETCRVRSHRGASSSKMTSISFQNPNRFAERLLELYDFNIKNEVSDAIWYAIHRGFMKRHLLAHTSGIVDAQYITETSDPAAIIGRRILILESEIREFAELLHSIGRLFIERLPKP